MPIRPEMKERYPKNWQEISQRIRARAGNKCEWCGVPNYELGGRHHGKWMKAQPRGDDGLNLQWPKPGEWDWCGNGETEGKVRLRIVRIVLTVAHVHDHSPENCADDNLACLCQRCHNKHDAKHRRAGIERRRRERSALGDLLERSAPK